MITCKICNDTHSMWLSDLERYVQCTHCPIPCDECRRGQRSYCDETPCACDCHIRALESQAAPGTDGVHPVVRVTSYGMYEIIGPDGQIIATVESEKTADSIAKAIVFGPIAAPGKVVAGEGWKQKLRKSLDDLMENHLCENSTALQGMKGLKALESILDEVTELPAPTEMTKAIASSHLNAPIVSNRNEFALQLAAALIAAATKPQKGKG